MLAWRHDFFLEFSIDGCKDDRVPAYMLVLDVE